MVYSRLYFFLFIFNWISLHLCYSFKCNLKLINKTLFKILNSHCYFTIINDKLWCLIYFYFFLSLIAKFFKPTENVNDMYISDILLVTIILQLIFYFPIFKLSLFPIIHEHQSLINFTAFKLSCSILFKNI